MKETIGGSILGFMSRFCTVHHSPASLTGLSKISFLPLTADRKLYLRDSFIRLKHCELVG